MGWANRITLLRAVLTLVLWAVLAVTAPRPGPGTWWFAFALFLVTALTDVVDGIVARRFGEVSVFGRLADPLVDKLLVLGTMIALLAIDDVRPVLPAWAVALMLAREFVVTALRGAVEGRGVPFQAAPIGKAKMLLQSIAVGAVLLHGAGVALARQELALGPLGPWSVAQVVVLLATLLTVVSGIDYSARAARLLRDA